MQWVRVYTENTLGKIVFKNLSIWTPFTTVHDHETRLYDRAKFILLFQKMLCLFGLLGLLVTDNPFVHIHIAYVGHKITSKEIKTDLLSIYFKQDFLTTWTL